jgi:hypothetical protein
MKIGDYVRTINGISKIIKIQDIITSDNEYITTLITHDNGNCDISNILKSSPNIIDLIEVGDYVNGEIVIEINKEANCIAVTEEGYWEHINEVKTIVTKEQFESMEYKI